MIEKLKLYNETLVTEELTKLNNILNANTPNDGASLIPLFNVANKHLDNLTTLERRLNFLERMVKNNEESNNKQ